MHELYDLKDKLMKELEEYGKGEELSAGSLEIVDKLTHTIKNLCKIIDECDDGYSGRYYPHSYRRSYRGYSRRDGRYSRDNGMVEELRTLMEEAPDEHTRSEFQRFITKLENR